MREQSGNQLSILCVEGDTLETVHLGIFADGPVLTNQIEGTTVRIEMMISKVEIDAIVFDETITARTGAILLGNLIRATLQ